MFFGPQKPDNSWFVSFQVEGTAPHLMEPGWHRMSRVRPLALDDRQRFVRFWPPTLQIQVTSQKVIGHCYGGVEDPSTF